MEAYHPHFCFLFNRTVSNFFCMNFVHDGRFESSCKSILKTFDEFPEVRKKLYHNLDLLLNRLEFRDEDLSRMALSERNKLNERLNQFDWERSKGYEMIKKKGWDQLNHKELRSIAVILAKKCNITLDREAKRRKPILVKWFDDNWCDISKIIGRFALLDQNESPISGHRELVDFCKS